MVIMPSGVPADLGAGASLGDLSVGDAGLVALRFAGFFAAGAGYVPSDPVLLLLR